MYRTVRAIGQAVERRGRDIGALFNRKILDPGENRGEEKRRVKRGEEYRGEEKGGEGKGEEKRRVKGGEEKGDRGEERRTEYDEREEMRGEEKRKDEK